jgi:3-hydroxy-D-aspartate aldolase
LTDLHVRTATAAEQRGVNALAQLPTPLLTLDVDSLEANIEAMAERIRGTGVGLRPHAKVHKSVEIATRQMAAGAVGLCVSSVSEAEAMVEGGLGNVLLTTPIADPGKAARICEMAGTATGIVCVVDSSGQVAMLRAEAERRRTLLRVLIDVDVGRHRTGVPTLDRAVALAREVASSGHLIFQGLQAYAGQIQHVADYQERRRLAGGVAEGIAKLAAALTDTGLPPSIVTGSGTGSHDIDRRSGAYTDLQTGSYIFPDVFYGETSLFAGDEPVFRPALTVWTRIISNNQERLMITDGGFKCMAGPKDIAPRVLSGAPPDSIYRFEGAEHGSILLPPGAPKLQLGAMVQCLPPYADATVHLFRDYTVIRRGRLAEFWPIQARGHG